MGEEAEENRVKPAIPALLEALELKLLKGEPELFGFVGYFGWNYESATALSALLLRRKEAYLVNRLLYRATQFPFTGFWMKHGLPVLWLGSPGDRVGLFGSLYKDADQKVFRYTMEVLQEWPRYGGAIVRNYGWNGQPGRFIWADDAFMAGRAILQSDPAGAQDLITSTAAILRDVETGLFWHGCRVTLGSGEVTYNGVKWGRANAWILLAAAEIVRVTGKPLTLLNESLHTVRKFQRESGAFGNIVDVASSPDETSLTSAYIYAVAIHAEAYKYTRFIGSAQKAWKWLNSRSFHFDGRLLLLDSTAGGTNLGKHSRSYDSNVGSHQGPGIGLAVWANEGLCRINWFDARNPIRYGGSRFDSSRRVSMSSSSFLSSCQAIFAILVLLWFLLKSLDLPACRGRSCSKEILGSPSNTREPLPQDIDRLP